MDSTSIWEARAYSAAFGQREPFHFLTRDGASQLAYLTITPVGVVVEPASRQLYAPFIILYGLDLQVLQETTQGVSCLCFRSSGHALHFSSYETSVKAWVDYLESFLAALAVPPSAPCLQVSSQFASLSPLTASPLRESFADSASSFLPENQSLEQMTRKNSSPSRFLAAAESLSPRQPRQARLDASAKISAPQHAMDKRSVKTTSGKHEKNKIIEQEDHREKASPEITSFPKKRGRPPKAKPEKPKQSEELLPEELEEQPSNTGKNRKETASKVVEQRAEEAAEERKRKQADDRKSKEVEGGARRPEEGKNGRAIAHTKRGKTVEAAKKPVAMAGEESERVDSEGVASQSSERVDPASKAEICETPVAAALVQENAANAEAGARKTSEKYWSIDEKAKEAMQQEGKRVTRGEVRRILAPPPPPEMSTEPKEPKKRKKPGTKKRELVLSTATVIAIKELPEMFEEILAALPQDNQSAFDMFEIQNFVITAALDEQGFSAADPNVREKILNYCIETIKADTTNRFVKGTKKGRVDLNVVGEHDLAVLQRYNTYLNSPEQQSLRQAYKGGMYRRVWTEAELRKFEEALKLYPSGPGSTKKIAAYIGGHVTQRNVVYLKNQRKQKMRRLGINKETVDASEAVAALSNFQSAARSFDLDNPETWIGKKVRVWYSNLRRYYIGTVLSCDYKKGEFLIDWGNGEIVATELLKQNCTMNSANPDRWNFVREDDARPAPAAVGAPAESKEEKKSPESSEKQSGNRDPAEEIEELEPAGDDDDEVGVEDGEKEDEEEEEEEEEEGGSVPEISGES